MKRTIWWTSAFTVVIVGIVGAVRVGLYNVAATNPHFKLTNALLHTVMRYSVKARASGIATPPLDDPALIEQGFADYREMCQVCHGAPGIDPDEAGKGLTPRPPDLTRTAGRWSDAELFWIIKNGVRMTGMPAWGPTHDDARLWSMVAFVRRLPSLSARDYASLVEEARGKDMHHRKDAH